MKIIYLQTVCFSDTKIRNNIQKSGSWIGGLNPGILFNSRIHFSHYFSIFEYKDSFLLKRKKILGKK